MQSYICIHQTDAWKGNIIETDSNDQNKHHSTSSLIAFVYHKSSFTNAFKKEMKAKNGGTFQGHKWEDGHSQLEPIPLKVISSLCQERFPEIEWQNLSPLLNEQSYPPQFSKDGVHKTTTTKGACSSYGYSSLVR